MTKWIFGAAVAALLFGFPAARAQEGGGPSIETIARNCTGCHGLDGKSPGAIPTIYQKSADWMTQRLIEFRDGKRESALMGRIMKGFADEDIRKLAEYFADQK